MEQFGPRQSMARRTRSIAGTIGLLSVVNGGCSRDLPPATVVIRNTGEAPKSFVLEPWGEIYSLPPAARVEVSVVGPAGTPEITVNDESITFWAWSGSTATVKLDD